MEKRLTVRDYLKNHNIEANVIDCQVMIQFTKLHVERALKVASEKARTKEIFEGNTGSEYCETIVDKDSILNSYSIDNIL